MSRVLTGQWDFISKNKFKKFKESGIHPRFRNIQKKGGYLDANAGVIPMFNEHRLEKISKSIHLHFYVYILNFEF